MSPFERTVYQPAPARFEAGTGNFADAVGLGAAIDYVSRIGIENIERHEQELLGYRQPRRFAVSQDSNSSAPPRQKAWSALVCPRWLPLRRRRRCP